MRIRWSLKAANDLEAIKTYLLQQRPELAQSTVQTLYGRVLSLQQSPNRGRPGTKEPNTRELVCAPLPYIVVYEVTKDHVHILHIHHAARNRQ